MTSPVYDVLFRRYLWILEYARPNLVNLRIDKTINLSDAEYHFSIFTLHPRHDHDEMQSKKNVNNIREQCITFCRKNSENTPSIREQFPILFYFLRISHSVARPCASSNAILFSLFSFFVFFFFVISRKMIPVKYYKLCPRPIEEAICFEFFCTTSMSTTK